MVESLLVASLPGGEMTSYLAGLVPAHRVAMEISHVFANSPPTFYGTSSQSHLLTMSWICLNQYWTNERKVIIICTYIPVQAVKLRQSIYGEEHVITKRTLDLFTVIYAEIGKEQYSGENKWSSL